VESHLFLSAPSQTATSEKTVTTGKTVTAGKTVGGIAFTHFRILIDPAIIQSLFLISC